MTTESPAQNQIQNQNSTKSRWAFAISTFFGVGYLKPGPGTWASIAAVLLWAAAAWGLHLSQLSLNILLAAGIVLAVTVGVPAATVAAREAGREDPGFVVIDEVAGQWIALLGCPRDWPHALIALALFRLLDITKPPPARQLEQLPGGWGIVFDDVAAGLYAVAIAALVRIWY